MKKLRGMVGRLVLECLKESSKGRLHTETCRISSRWEYFVLEDWKSTIVGLDKSFHFQGRGFWMHIRKSKQKFRYWRCLTSHQLLFHFHQHFHWLLCPVYTRKMTLWWYPWLTNSHHTSHPWKRKSISKYRKISPIGVLSFNDMTVESTIESWSGISSFGRQKLQK